MHVSNKIVCFITSLFATGSLYFWLLSAADAEEGTQASPAISRISQELCADMKSHKVLRENLGCQRLMLVRISYIGFDGQLYNGGEIVVMDAAADHVLQIFDSLRKKHFPISNVKLINKYEGADEASMADNNTSAFNDRPTTGGSSLSIHAYGLAIDLNPVQNPYLHRGRGILQVSPKNGAEYLDRTKIRPGMAESVIEVFADNGFPIWGGDWKDPTDYQHFQVSRSFANQLAHSSPAKAKAAFDRFVAQYRECRRAGRDRKQCIGDSAP
jgi:hypothetical protein